MEWSDSGKEKTLSQLSFDVLIPTEIEVNRCLGEVRSVKHMLGQDYSKP